jgi:hypothetical protein
MFAAAGLPFLCRADQPTIYALYQKRLKGERDW